MKSFLMLIVGFFLGVGAMIFWNSNSNVINWVDVEVMKTVQFENTTQPLGKLVLAHPKAKGATWEKKENGTFFVNVDIGKNEIMELVFRVKEGTKRVEMIRARILKGSKVIPCKYPDEVLLAMDNGTSFSKAGCEESNALLDALL